MNKSSLHITSRRKSWKIITCLMTVAISNWFRRCASSKSINDKKTSIKLCLHSSNKRQQNINITYILKEKWAPQNGWRFPPRFIFLKQTEHFWNEDAIYDNCSQFGFFHLYWAFRHFEWAFWNCSPKTFGGHQVSGPVSFLSWNNPLNIYIYACWYICNLKCVSSPARGKVSWNPFAVNYVRSCRIT